MAAKKSKKERMKEAASKKIDAAEVRAKKSEEKEKVSAPSPVPQSAICEAMTVKDTVMVVLYSVLLFLAMTIQTWRMSIVLIVLAIALSVGKTPLANLRAHLSLPVVGLLAFVLMSGLAALYSRFGATAASELYKVMAAFSLAVILLVRFEKKHIRGLLWGFASVCAVIALLCVDMGCWGKLFGAFNTFAELLGATYEGVIENSQGIRINGIYNDANLTGALLGLAVFVCIYLAHTAEKQKERFVALMLFGVSAVSFVVAMSRGAILAFAVAVVVYLLLEGKETRTHLFFLMLSAGVPAVGLGVLTMLSMEEGSVLPVLMVLLCGAAAFGIDWMIGSRISRKLDGHGKLAATISVGMIALLVVAGIVVMQATEPFVVGDDGRFTRSMVLDAGDYTLSCGWNGASPTRLVVQSRSREQFLMETASTLYDGTVDEVAFSVPEDAARVYFYFWGDPGCVLECVTLSDGTELPMAYTFLPENIVSRLQDITMNGSILLRIQFMKDGLTLFRQSPIIGHGLGSTENLMTSVQPIYYESLYVHNHLIQVMDEMGVIGLACFLLLLVGSVVMLLRRRMETADPLAVMLIACWVMMNIHSAIEINFSIRMYQCATFFLLLLPALAFAKPLPEKWLKRCGYIAAAVIWTELAVFGFLLQRHISVREEAERFSASSAEELMDGMQSFAERAPFDKETYQLSFIANGVSLDAMRYNATLLDYVEELRSSGVYSACHSLNYYYYLPIGDFEELFACSREALAQVASASDAWNMQVDFYRNEVLAAAGSEHLEEFFDGVLELEDYLASYNEGRLESVVLSTANQEFVASVNEVVKMDISAEEKLALLSE